MAYKNVKDRKAYRDKHYRDNRAYYKQKKREQVDRAKQFVSTYLREHPCVDCGEIDPIVLEFDHVRGTKKFHISTGVLRGRGPKSLAEEIAKCEVRCANCHRRKTISVSGLPA